MNKPKAAGARRLFKTAAAHVLVSLFAILFDNVYALFGHGVRSDAMSYMFLYSILGGAAFFFLLGALAPKITGKKGYRLFYNLQNSAIAILMTGSVLQGILEIAGGSFRGLWIFYAAGWVFAAAGLCVLCKAIAGKEESIR